MHRVCGVMVVVGGLFLAVGCGRNESKEFKEFSSPESKFKVQIPGEPKKQTQQAAGVGFTTYTVEERNGAYTVAVADMPIPANEPEAKIQDRLDGAQAGALSNIKASLISSKKITLDGKYPGREFRGALPDNKGIVRAKIYIVGQRLYQVLVVGTEKFAESADASKFLDSFAVLP